jgi:Zn-finger nucleic acid-binding protein
MHCSSCKTARLEPRELEPGLIAAVCQQCDGALVSLMNYRFWLDRYGTTGDQESTRPLDVPDEQPGVRACPKCSRLMTKYQMGINSSHKIDLCAACDEAWLDKGEWQLLKHLDLHGKLPRIFTDAWQRNIRKARQEAFQQDRYEKLLGEDDFGHVNEFRQWLYRHPRKEDIKQFIMIAPE